MAVALPEIPDDRRAQPRRSGSVRNPAPPEPAVPPANGRVGGRHAQPPGRVPPAQRPGEPNGRPQPPPARGNGAARPAHRQGGSNGRPAVPPVPGQAPRGGGAPRRPVQQPAGAQRAAARRAAGPVRTARPPVIPAQGAPVDDRPTTDLGGPLDAPETEAFGAVEAPATSPAAPRRRRRAGESSNERLASTYRAQLPAGAKAPRTGRRRRPAFWKELPLLVVVALLLTFLIQTFLAKVYVIPSGSMETTLHGCSGCSNDRVVVDKVTYNLGDPAPGDVVVFRGPDSWSSEISVDPPSNALLRGLQQFGSLIGLAPPNEKDFVKRVIATGGQTVQCCDPRNRVLVDGEPLEEPYIWYEPDAGPPLQQGFGPFVVPQGHLWMMGDSRNNSSDSRATGHGAVPIDNVIGQARFIVLPPQRFSGIDSVNPQEPAVGMGVGPGAPAALGLLVALPFALRRRPARDVEDEFLPARPRPRR